MTTGRLVRTGAVAVETAFVLPVVCLLVISFVVGGVQALRYQQLACLSREGARWASVRGADFEGDGFTPPTKQQVIDQAVLPFAAGFDPASLTVRVELVDKAKNTVADWDASTKPVRSVTATGEYVSNTVRVTVTYQLGSVFGDTLTMQGVCETPMMN